jgi:hypothetical protein
MAEKRIWGFLRETTEDAKKAGLDKDTGLCRTGLEDYLSVIFPETSDWIHDKPIGTLSDGTKCLKRPDYRSESLGLIVEFDGTPHYKSPSKIKDDKEKTILYRKLGYNVVRIPYFIQLTNDAVFKLFGVTVSEPLFDVSIPSMGIKGENTPAYLCGLGLLRMASEFSLFPDQYEVNARALELMDNEILTGLSLLKQAYAFILTDTTQLQQYYRW